MIPDDSYGMIHTSAPLILSGCPGTILGLTDLENDLIKLYDRI